MADRPLLILVDGHAVAYRAYFALPVDQFSTSEGEPTNAVFGFTRMLMDILAEQPNYLAVSFDMGLTGRDQLYSEYKGTRDKMPNELERQMTPIENIVKAFNIPVLTLADTEADDVIGTVAKQAEAEGCQVRIITGDRDLLQLLSEHTDVQLPDRTKGSKGGDAVWNTEKFLQDYEGLTPAQLPDYKGLVGDTSDNIPGVAGVGDGGATTLLKKYHSIENLYDHVDEITGRYKKHLEAGRDMAFLSKQLATIHRDLPLTIDLKACIAHDFDGNIVRDLFHKMEFRTLTRQLDNLLNQQAGNEEAVATVALEAFVPSHTVVTTPEQLDKLVQVLNNAKMIAFDTETTSIDNMIAELVGISLAVDIEEGYYIPVGHISPNVQPSLFGGNEAPPQLPMETVIEALRPALTNPRIGKVAHNGLYDLIVLRRYGIDVSPISEDTMIMEWIRDPGSKFLGLKDLAFHRKRIKMVEITELIGSGKNQITMDRVPIEKAAGYAAADAVATLRVLQSLDDDLKNTAKNPNARKLYESLEIPLIPVLANMEMEGVLIDRDYFQQLSVDLTATLKAREKEIFQAAGKEFNVGSYQQLNEVLFNHLGLPTEGLSKNKSGGFSLTAAVLDELAERVEHPVLRLIMEHRSLSKLLGTYVDALPLMINPRTGRVHTSFNQTGAVTGRISSSVPNLQNIPIRTEEGRRVRQGFIAEPGCLVLSVDYSQIELRILADYSHDETLRAAFEHGEDVHRTTAAKVYNIPPEEVTFNQRRFAKAVNFGLMYGMGAFRLARDSDLTLAEAEAFIKAYFQNFPGVRDHLDGTKAFVAQNGYVETRFGRRRWFPELTNMDANRQTRARAEREAINMPIQGTAADIIKIAMINLDRELRERGMKTRLLLQVHDELVLETPEDEADTAKKLVVEIMEAAGDTPFNEKGQRIEVPIIADAKLGKNWAQLEK